MTHEEHTERIEILTSAVAKLEATTEHHAEVIVMQQNVIQGALGMIEKLTIVLNAQHNAIELLAPKTKAAATGGAPWRN